MPNERRNMIESRELCARKRNFKTFVVCRFAMSPNSLANRTTHKRDCLRPIPAHRRFASIVNRLPKRGRAVLALALILLVWRIAEPTTTRLKGESRSRPTITTPSKAVKFASPHLNIPKVQVRYQDGSSQGVLARRTLEGAQKEKYNSLWSQGSVQGIEGVIGIEIKLIDQDGKETIVDIGEGSVCEHVDCGKIKGVRAELNLAKGLRQLRTSSSFSTFLIRNLKELMRDSNRRSRTPHATTTFATNDKAQLDHPCHSIHPISHISIRTPPRQLGRSSLGSDLPDGSGRYRSARGTSHVARKIREVERRSSHNRQT